jgi:hypothetical protein
MTIYDFSMDPLSDLKNKEVIIGRELYSIFLF